MLGRLPRMPGLRLRPDRANLPDHDIYAKTSTLPTPCFGPVYQAHGAMASQHEVFGDLLPRSALQRRKRGSVIRNRKLWTKYQQIGEWGLFSLDYASWSTVNPA
jgi:hypothetical protein